MGADEHGDHTGLTAFAYPVFVFVSEILEDFGLAYGNLPSSFWLR